MIKALERLFDSLDVEPAYCDLRTTTRPTVGPRETTWSVLRLKLYLLGAFQNDKHLDASSKVSAIFETL